MQINAEQLPDHLARGLAPLYLLAGDEPLLKQEARDAIRLAAREAGIDERHVLHIERADSWRAVSEQADSLSLFATRKVLDVRLEKDIDAAAEAALLGLAQHLNSDDVLIVSTNQIDKRNQNKPWFKAVQGAGVHVQIWPVRSNEMPRWLEQRARRAGVRLEREALRFLVSQVEGNLLAAVQQLELLRLLDAGKVWDVDALAAIVDDAAHFEVFGLLDAACAADTQRCMQMLRNFRLRGDHALAIASAFAGQLRRLISLAEQVAAGASAEQAILEGRIYGRDRQAAWRRVLERASAAELWRALASFATLDQQVKGLRRGDPWQTFELIVMAVAGRAPALFDANLERFELRMPVGM